MKRTNSAIFIGIFLVLALVLLVWLVYSYQPATKETPLAYGGIPVSRGAGQVTLLKNNGYWAGYSETRRDPLWVVYRLKKINSHAQTAERPSKFTVDGRTKAKVSHDAYTGSGYDRGHMAPNYAIASRYGRKAQLETFLMSNICPQRPNLNRKVWEHLEFFIANKYAQEFEEVWIITGPVFDEHIERLNSGVEIPDSFYSIIIDEKDNRPRVLAFIIPQGVIGSESLDQFLVNVDKIEALTKLDFMPELPDELENKLEAKKAEKLW